MLIYTPKLTNRIRYAMQLVFQDVWQQKYELTTDWAVFEAYDGPKLNYSNRQQGEELFVGMHGLLQEKGISDQEIQLYQWEETPVFFTTTSKASIPFDVFSAAFYLVSRYEEYLPHIRDHYERFMAKESLAFQKGFLQKPLVNIWLKKFLSIIQKHYPAFVDQSSGFRYSSTIDIDNAFCYKHKGVVRTAGAFARSLWENDQEAIKERWEVLRGRQQDPFDTFDLQLQLQAKYKLEVIYFVLLADYGLNDKNIPVQSRPFQLLIKHLADHAKVGIHPSFGSNYQSDKLLVERDRLQKIVKREVTASRQHFLKLSFPQTYRNLLELDITDDYTMGYAAQPGFRASICTPFHFYDLELEKMTPLKIHPFVVMDATFRYYLDYTPEQSLQLIKALVDEVKAVDGHFVSLWHNETWSEHGTWKSWSSLFEKMVQYIQS
jgi:hypothetical protein